MSFLGFVLGVSALVMVIVAVVLLLRGRIGPAIGALVLGLLVGAGAGALIAAG